MITRTRTRGDDYPLYVVYKVNGLAIDLTGSILKFSYKNANNEIFTITGTPTDNVGEAEFIPNSGVDFMVSDIFTFDVTRVAGGYTYTHQKGTLIIDDDVTP